MAHMPARRRHITLMKVVTSGAPMFHVKQGGCLSRDPPVLPAVSGTPVLAQSSNSRYRSALLAYWRHRHLARHLSHHVTETVRVVSPPAQALPSGLGFRTRPASPKKHCHRLSNALSPNDFPPRPAVGRAANTSVTVNGLNRRATPASRPQTCVGG